MKSKTLRRTLAIAMSAATLLTSAVSLNAFAADTESVQTASASEVTYVENHSVIDCANYYVDGSNYRFLVKVPIGTPLSAITVKNVYTDTTQKLSELQTSTELGAHFTGITYMYTDSTSDCYTLSYYIYPGCDKYMWYEYGIKLYYDYNGNHYMATNTSNNSTTEGSGYILKR